MAFVFYHSERTQADDDHYTDNVVLEHIERSKRVSTIRWSSRGVGGQAKLQAWKEIADHKVYVLINVIDLAY